MKFRKILSLLLIVSIMSICFGCKKNDENFTPADVGPTYTTGLSYSLNKDGKSYTLVGIGDSVSESLIIPDSYNNLPIISIGETAFENYEFIKSVVIPDSIITIETSAFKNCIGLTSLTLGENVKFIGSNAFYGCTNLQNFEFGKSLESIGQLSFAACTNITSLKFPDTLFSIGHGAFSGCLGLTSITFNENLKSIGNESFRGCLNLNEINYNCIEVDDLYSIGSTFYQAGQNSSSGIAVTIGKQVKRIPAYLFKCHTSYTHHINITTLVFEPGCVCEYIGEYAFDGLIQITQLKIPNSIKTIKTNAFANCEKLTALYYNATNASCASDFLYGSNSEMKIYIGDNVTHIPDYIFNLGDGQTNRTPNIVAINFTPDSICKSFGVKAFYGTSITNIYIPSTIEFLGENCFGNCKNLTVITFDGSTNQWQLIEKSTLGVSTGTIVICSDGNIVL